METLKKIVSNQYFPAAAVLTAVLLFWTIAMFGGLSLLHNNQPPMATLTWMLFVYGAAVLTPLAGIIAAADLIRRWRRNRQYAHVDMAEYESAEYDSAAYESAAYESMQDGMADPEAAPDEAAETEQAEDAQATPETPGQAAAPQPAKQQRTQPKQRKTAA
ncbi:MAG: hypothetical protein ABI568_12305 [Pseudarthrobacter sp.]